MVSHIPSYLRTSTLTTRLSLRLLILFVFSVLLITNANATLTARVDRNPVVMNESFTFTLESDESLSTEPDFSVLQSDFDIINKQQSNSFRMINGNTSRSLQWTVTLLAKNSGIFVIPAIKIDQQQSQPIRLTVSKVTNSSNSGLANQQDLFIKVETTPDKIYVQQQILFTINLYYAQDSGLNLAQGSSLSEPELESGDAVIKKLGQDKNFQSNTNGRPYTVIQRRYAVFPQKSGKITFKPVIFEGRIIQQYRNQFGMDPFQQNTRIKRVQSDSIVLDIKPIPTQFSGKTWLPANDIQLVEDWPEVNKDWYAGEPLTRTIALFADGLTSAQLPAVRADIPDGVKQYPDQPILKDTPSNSGFNGIHQNKIALIPSHAGSFTFPEIQIRWWNTKTDKQETATLPAKTVNVLAAKTSTGNQENLAITPEAAPVILPNQSVTDKADSNLVATLPVTTPVASNWWPWVSLLLACGWLLTLFGGWKQKLTNGQKKAQLNKNVATTNNIKLLQQSVQRACDSNDAEAAKQALLDWSAVVWPEQKVFSLGAIAESVNDEFKQQLKKLEQSLYAKEKTDWKGSELWLAFKNFQPVKNKQTTATQLRPLYPPV